MARRIPDSLLDEIRDGTDILGLVSEYVTLKKSGRSYKGLCPFHQEKTPSFNVSPDRGIFHCFGCGAGGNAFTFLMRIEGMEFIEAVRLLADKAGLKLPKATDEDAAKAGNRERLLALLKRASALYHRQLLDSSEAEVARRYLDGRGIGEASIKEFCLGYAPKAWDYLLKKAQARGVSMGDLESSGLVIRSERATGGWYDRFRERLVFPISDHRGQIVGFGGRVLEPDAKEAKYINTPETALYSKSRLLYGLEKARRHAQDSGELLVTEGYLDVITAHHYGVSNIVATLGTALTEQHARMIGRYAEKAVLVFDSDQAGVAAARRGADLLVAQGLQVDVMTLPPGDDPDSYLRSAGLEAFEEARRGARPLVEFLLAQVMERPDISSAAGKGRAAGELLSVIDRIPNKVERDEAFRLVADSLRVREEVLREELKRVRAEARRPAGSKSGARSSEKEDLRGEEVLLLRILLQEREAVEAVAASGFDPEVLKDERLRVICAALLETAKGGSPDLAGLLNHLPGPDLEDLAVRLAETPHGLEDFRAGLSDCLAQVGGRAIREEVLELERALKEAEAAGRHAEVRNLLLRRMELQKAIST